MLDAEPSDAIDIVFSALGATERHGDGARRRGRVGARCEAARRPRRPAPALRRVGSAGKNRRGRPPRAGPRDGSRRHRRRDAGGMRHGVGAVRASPFRWRLRRCARCAGSIPMPAFTRSACRASAAVATRLDPAAWQSAVALGRRAVAHQIAGASRAMLDLARTHALERVQFGRPIARFQAVRHRLADALVAVEALEATLTRGQGGAEPRHGGAREGRRRTHGAHGGRTLPAGARRHRLHHGASVPPLPQADHRARGALRIGRRDRPGRRTAAARRAPGSDAHRAVTPGTTEARP